MLIRKPPEHRWSEVTPRSAYLNRRRFFAGMAAGAAFGLAGSARGGVKLGPLQKSRFSTSEPLTPFKVTSEYNNYYEFGTAKDQPHKLAHTLVTSPWEIKVEGAVNKKTAFSIDEIMKMAPLEERIYRHRCVEGWSIVVPWIGFSLSELIKRVEPLGKAKYVQFTSIYDPGQMPGQRRQVLEWPYVEGLRMDEAMHPLALLCFGMYGEELPNQDGAPLRIVLPWKYGFKSAKAIVRIRFTEKQPMNTWNISAPREYGFYANVNPNVDHPRWSQAKERRLGEFTKRPTLMFNGYDQVASLYSGMDLKKNF